MNVFGYTRVSEVIKANDLKMCFLFFLFLYSLKFI